MSKSEFIKVNGQYIRKSIIMIIGEVQNNDYVYSVNLFLNQTQYIIASGSRTYIDELINSLIDD